MDFSYLHHLEREKRREQMPDAMVKSSPYYSCKTSLFQLALNMSETTIQLDLTDSDAVIYSDNH